MPTGADFEAVKYFGIGLSRTGTTSLTAAMRSLGYTACHWSNPEARRIISIEDFLTHDAAFDIPVSAFFEHLFHAFPNARFIYSEREIGAWTAAVSRHYSAESPQLVKQRLAPWPIKGLFAPARFVENAAAYHAIHHSLYLAHPTWEAAYRAHEQRVLSFFSGDRAGKLLRIEVAADPEPWITLCGFLETEAPQLPFPHKIVTPARVPGVPPAAAPTSL